MPNQENNGKYQYITYITKYNSIDQGLYLLYNNHLKSDILLVFFEMKSSMMHNQSSLACHPQVLLTPIVRVIIPRVSKDTDW